MKKFYLKITILAIAYLAAMLWQGCDLIDPCNCPEVDKPFFDYKDIAVECDTVAGQTFEITVQPDSAFFTAEAVPCERSHFSGLLTSAFACSCLSEGERGDKFPISNLDILADKQFRDILPGFSLNKYFEFSTRYFSGSQYLPLEPGHNTSFDFADQKFLLRLKDFPTSPETFTFKIVIEKASGRVLEKETKPVKFF